MNETLKGVAHIGAELAAVKADLQRELERHRKTWRQLEQLKNAMRRIIERCEVFIDDEAEMSTASVEALMGIAEDALSLQAEPAPAQDEREAPQVVARLHESPAALFPATELTELGVRVTGTHDLMTVAQHERIVASLTRPAQTAPQPVGWAEFVEKAAILLNAEQARLCDEDYLMDHEDCITVLREHVTALSATPSPAMAAKEE